jgi:tetratricopeptide (TPR) repeat protein
MKKLLLIFFVLVCSVFAFAQTQRDWWYTFERGKHMFRQGDYGNALLVFEDARRQRRAVYERMERDFINLLSIGEVRRLGDSLDLIERYIHDRGYTSAAAALQELYYRVPKENFNNSANAALAAFGTLKDYPEAELWIGETYLLEGELSLALSQFQKVHAMRYQLENPGFATELLYKIAAIRRTRQEYNEMIRVLDSILSTDRLWDSSNTFIRQAMTRTLETFDINRFLTTYRHGNTESVEAHRLLGYYYYSSGRHSSAQEHLMFAFLIQNTVIIDELIRQRFDFTFTTLEALAAQINSNRFLSEYVQNNDYYKIAYYLGASLYGNGKTAPAMGIWQFLSTQSNAGEWQSRAAGQLRSPHIERIIEMP